MLCTTAGACFKCAAGWLGDPVMWTPLVWRPRMTLPAAHLRMFYASSHVAAILEADRQLLEAVKAAEGDDQVCL
jgi:hypothetical protein